MAETMCVRVHRMEHTDGVANVKKVIAKLTIDWLTSERKTWIFMHIGREFLHLGPPITSQLRQNKHFHGTAFDRTSRAFGPIDVWDFLFFFVGLPNVYTNVLGSQKENSIQSYRRATHIEFILLVYISHFSADTLTHKMSFVFFFLLLLLLFRLFVTEHQILISRRTLALRRQNKWQIYRATNQPFYVSQFYYCL